MRQIVPPVRIVQKILGKQKTDERAPYRLTAHCLRTERPEGSLLYHTLTGELLLLSGEEAELLEELPGPVPPLLRELVPRWFLRPEGADDMALADQVLQTVAHFQKKENRLTKYLIFTTTACNARCFYCFETGWEKATMSDETALATAGYIAGRCGGKPVHLEWSGGEPLMNVRAIDVITDSLRERGVGFRSWMISNGYLLDEDLVRRAREAWHLERVQITLDGTEAVYNARKAYVHPEGSPFQRVLRNIGLLLDEGIAVKVRLNMDGDNERDLYVLIDQLAERFGGKPGFGVYLAVLRKNVGVSPSDYTEEERRSCARKYSSLQGYAEGKGVVTRLSLDGGFVVNACVADNDTFTTVRPDGRLGRCGSCKNGSSWGSVYVSEADEAVIRQWKERKPPEAACRSCAFYPQCIRLKMCPNSPGRCSPAQRAYREDRLRRAMLGSYEEWKAAGQDRQAAIS